MGVVVIYTRTFAKYFNEFLFVILLSAGVVRTILVTNNGSVSLGQLPIAQMMSRVYAHGIYI